MNANKLDPSTSCSETTLLFIVDKIARFSCAAPTSLHFMLFSVYSVVLFESESVEDFTCASGGFYFGAVGGIWFNSEGVVCFGNVCVHCIWVA